MDSKLDNIPKPKVETVCLNFLGTGHHRETHKYIINRYHEAMELHAQENKGIAVRLFDGPGSTPKSRESMHPIPGTYIYDPETNTKKVVDPVVARKIDDVMKSLSGIIVGGGVEDLLFEAILYVNKIIKDNNGELPRPLTCMVLAVGLMHVCVWLIYLINYTQK